MRMEQQVLPPGVQNAEDADLGAQVFGVGGHRPSAEAALRCEQQVIERARVLPAQSTIQFVRHGEDDVKIAGR